LRRNIGIGVLIAGVLACLLLAPPATGHAAPGASPLLSPGCIPARPHNGGTTIVSLATVDGLRSYRLHVPGSYTGDTAVPLVINMHGAGSSSFEEEIYSGFSTKSEANGFVVAYPQGLTTALFPFAHWNAFQGPSPEPDDPAFINAVIDALEAQLCIDQDRVFSTGISNGAIMSVRLACSLSSRIAAIGPVAGAYYPPESLDLNPFETCPDTAPVPIIAFHGTADPTVPFNGGYGGISQLMFAFRLPIDDNTPAEDVMSDWATHNGCAAARQETQVSSEVRLIEYGSCAAGTAVRLYAVDGGGHTWPGSAIIIPSLGYTTQQISATDLIWDFFVAHPAPDVDADGVPDGYDNCPLASNNGQANTDVEIDNGPGIAAKDRTIPNTIADTDGDACESDGDADNDGLPDASEDPLAGCGDFNGEAAGHPNPAGGDATNDDNGNGVPAPADAADNGPAWDTDNDGVLDGVECQLGTDPRNALSRPTTAACGGTADADGDGLSAAAERCKWGTSDANTDSDGDGKKDCVEANDTDGNGSANFTGDTVNSAKAALGVIGKTMDFDLDGNGNVSFTGDAVLSAKMVNHVGGICP